MISHATGAAALARSMWNRSPTMRVRCLARARVQLTKIHGWEIKHTVGYTATAPATLMNVWDGK